MKKKILNDEIEISNLILSLWENKIRIVIITTAFIILGFVYFYSQNKYILATTNIKPISNFENQKYQKYNKLNEDKILSLSSTFLYELFINKIKTEELIKEGILKFGLINEEEFKDQESYKDILGKTTISIIDKMQPPDKNNNFYWRFNFEIKDKKKWRNFLEYLETRANQEIRQYLINRFNTEVEILNINKEFQLEDIEQDIVNELDDYRTITNNRLAFLKEQAAIAHTLNIAKNTLEKEDFETDNTIITNIKSEKSYYLKGYEMIEKEIDLISSRKDEKAFIKNMLELEKKKRSILQNKKIERIKLLFSETPVNNKDNFIAAKIDFVATNYKVEKSLFRVLSISVIFGLIISFIYVFINNLIHVRK